MRRLALLTALAACLAVPAAATGATVWVVKGAGYGHGGGMSQYGAYGYALHGWDYRRILTHYYTGTTIGRVSQRPVRVLMQFGKGSIAVSGAARAGGKRLNPARTYIASKRGAGVSLRDSRGGRARRFRGPVRVIGARGFVRLGGTALNGVAGGTYRGGMELRPSLRGGMTAINVVGLDPYVRGVVPGEVPVNWPAQALRAQAVAARSYALATKAGGALFDQYASTSSQLYKGRSAEHPRTSAAVRATAGQVVLYRGKVAVTYFFSTSGGRTENIENVFSGAPPSPYLKSVKDPYDGVSPLHRWRFRFTPSQIAARLGSLCSGRFRALKVLKHGVSPRIVTAAVRCSGGTTRTKGGTLRTRLRLYDTWFRVTRATSAAGTRPKSAAVPLVSDLLLPRTVEGSFAPGPSRGIVDVERLDRGRWRLVARGLTNARGAYRVPVYATGTYRVSADGVSADPVTVR
jgi:stage II sporulation protein D